MDSNAKLGPTIIKEDPNEMTQNGEFLIDVVERQELCILNAHNKCSGLITRERTCEGKREASVLDFLICCENLERYFKELKIDEEKIYSLYRCKKSKMKPSSLVFSDHNMLIAKFAIAYKAQKPLRKEMYKFKCQSGKQKFFETTSYTSRFTECLKQDGNAIKSFEQRCSSFFRALKSAIHTSFKKVRMNNKKLNCYGDDRFNSLNS